MLYHHANKSWPHALAVATLALTACATMGCSYNSKYQPPPDGRARPVWQGDKIVMMAPEKAPKCTLERPSGPFTYRVPRDGAGHYVPRRRGYHGHHHHPVGIIVVGPHLPGPFIPLPKGKMSGDGGKYLLVVMAVGAIVAFPFIAAGLAMGHPEPEGKVAGAIDRINTFNDDAREQEAICDAIAVARGQR